uniref:NADH dehydrogenase subunit 4 n=1 Tax=Setodes brevicaudatus TaxID=1876047 RepID=UPI0022DCDF98|nr:NADH dehydrogenase subunit 4 [Setodes brevicaudatus]UZZ44385.1 NADH dehydrogenase subunit 4 [Setodes brevicaudatus]
MMKYIWYLIFLFFFINNYWLVSLFLIFFFFLILFKSINLFHFIDLSNILGMDLISYMLILLSVWVVILIYMASSMFYYLNYKLNYFTLNLIILLMFLFLTFSSMNMFLFYIFFECSLIPMLLMVFGWGYQSERFEASLYMLFYTLFASLPLMGGILFIFFEVKTMCMYFYKNLDISLIYMFLMMMMAFLVKLPMIFFHIWLPKAHVEAPVGGSMILAGILLKLGGYGLMRILIMFSFLCVKFNSLMISLCLVGSLYVCFFCVHQVDFKVLIAYSSVVHMGIFLVGLMMMYNYSVIGAFYMLIGHGLCSSGLFSLINMNYERIFSRSLFLNKGMLNVLPSLSLWYFLLLSSNMPVPFSLNLVSEVMIVSSMMVYSFNCMMLVLFLFFFSAYYNLYLFLSSQHGKIIFLKNNFYLLSMREYIILAMHWIPLNIFFLKLELVSILF